jgi:hypothetical protein
MKKLACTFVVCLCLVSVDCWAELTHKELQHIYETAENENVLALDNYLLGLYEGISDSNLAYYMQTKQFLYCKPNSFDLNVNDIKAVIKDAHEAYDTKGEIPVSFLLFTGLKQTFPCL